MLSLMLPPKFMSYSTANIYSAQEGMCQKRLVTYRAVIYKIAVDAVIGKTTMKDLLSSNQNKEARLIECLVLCRDHFQHLWH